MRLALAFVLLAFAYLWGLDRAGLIGPDEPRYALIGWNMAQSGDWVTPKLLGEPWLEKPPLLYWIIAAAYRAGLGDDWAPRFGVSLLAVLFLAAFYRLVRDEIDAPAALPATAILSSSPLFLGFSFAAVTDLPMTAFYTLSWLLALRSVRTGRLAWAALSGLLLALAVLAKGLVPLVLFLPVWPLLRFPWRPIGVQVLAFVLSATPWYAACYAANGQRFVDEFLIKHHWQRFVSDSIQHVQPWWFYAPVLLAAMLPWTSAAFFAQDPTFTTDGPASEAPWQPQPPRRFNRFLLCVGVFGFLFFSAARNKLPGYLLPLLPLFAAWLAFRLRTARRHAWIVASAAFWIPVLAAGLAILPQGLVDGFRWESLRNLLAVMVPAAFGTAALGYLAGRMWPVRNAWVVLAGLQLAGFLVAKATLLPQMDPAVSVRQAVLGWQPALCAGNLRRAAKYQLDFYLKRDSSECKPENNLRLVPSQRAYVQRVPLR
jgi:4-amino-4-deoxy-L-arabinose transferase-like glycosyltransferase